MNKTTGQKFVEFFYSLQIINDCLSLIEKGKKYQVLPIAAQLRAILVKDKQTPNPLFFYIHDILKIDQTIYIKDTVNDINCDGYIYHSHLIDISLTCEEGHSVKSNYSDWLDTVIIEKGEEKITITEVIKAVANKRGGAHYNDTIPEKIFPLMLIKQEDNMNLLDKLIKEIGDIICSVGLLVVKSQIDFHYIANIAIKNTSKISSPKNIITYQESMSYYPIAILLNSYKDLVLKITSPDGDYIVFPIDKHISDGIFIVSFSYEINEYYSGILRIYSNTEKRFITYIIENPFFIYNKFILLHNQFFSDHDLALAVYNVESHVQPLSEQHFKEKINSKNIGEETDARIIRGKHFVTIDSNNNLVLNSVPCGSYKDL